MKLAPFICFSIYVSSRGYTQIVWNMLEHCYLYLWLALHICYLYLCLLYIQLCTSVYMCACVYVCEWVSLRLFAKLEHIASHTARLAMWGRFCFMDTPKNFDTLCCPGHPRNTQVERIHRQQIELQLGQERRQEIQMLFGCQMNEKTNAFN